MRSIYALLFSFVTLIAYSGCAQEITLVNNNHSDYSIIVPKDASKLEKHAANVLQDYILRISGVSLLVQEEKKGLNGPGIYIGYTGKKEEVRPGKMAPESYMVQAHGRDLVICAGSGKGLIYGVYYFLEAYLHCEKLAGDIALTPVSKQIVVPGNIHDERKPQFVYREVYYPASHDPEYLEWRQLQQLDDLWGLWGHSFNKLVPASTYFKSNPEYYAEVNGTRQPSQLCLSNERVYEIVVAALKKSMATNPDALYWSVSPNDDDGYCQCALCRRVDEEYGGPSGSLIKFVNRVATAFPDKKITTLAYAYTHRAPKNLKPSENVYVFLSDIDAYRDKPLTEEGSAATFRNDLKDWGALTRNLFIWDYVTEFTNYLAPFPNFQTLQPNMQFLKDNNVQGIFAQGSGDTYSEWAELRSYLLAKLLEDDKADVKQLISSFFKGYYGPAGQYLQQYLDLVQSKMLASRRKLDIYGNPINEWNSYLTPDLLDQYSTLFDKAEAAAESNPVLADRVIRASLPLEYTVLQQARFYGIEKYGIFVKDKAGEWSVKPKFENKVMRFVANCKKAGVTELSEGGLNPDQYQAEWNAIFKAGVTPTKALGAPVTLKYPFAGDYPAKGNGTLTDGNPGYSDFSYNWLCFYGVPMVATIDLGKAITVSAIKMHFLDDPRHWIFLPEKVTIEVSADGAGYHPVSELSGPPNGEHYELSIKEFSTKNASFKPEPARYIRVTAGNLKALPSWRYRENKKPMIACDEIFVQ
jgi:hypothetical protein